MKNSDKDENPFVVGAKVAVFGGSRSNEFRRMAIVGKVYKNGNFVLAGSTEQWRSSRGMFNAGWEAWEAGSDRGWIGGRGKVLPLNKRTHRLVEEAKARNARWHRLHMIKDKVDKLRLDDIAVKGEHMDTLLDGLEKALKQAGLLGKDGV